MRFLPGWPARRGYRVVARGRLSAGSLRWAAVPGLQAGAFKDDHRRAANAVSFAHITRGVTARFPDCAARATRALEEVRALEAAYPGCVVFVLDLFDA